VQKKIGKLKMGGGGNVRRNMFFAQRSTVLINKVNTTNIPVQ